MVVNPGRKPPIPLRFYHPTGHLKRPHSPRRDWLEVANRFERSAPTWQKREVCDEVGFHLPLETSNLSCLIKGDWNSVHNLLSFQVFCPEAVEEEARLHVFIVCCVIRERCETMVYWLVVARIPDLSNRQLAKSQQTRGSHNLRWIPKYRPPCLGLMFVLGDELRGLRRWLIVRCIEDWTMNSGSSLKIRCLVVKEC